MLSVRSAPRLYLAYPGYCVTPGQGKRGQATHQQLTVFEGLMNASPLQRELSSSDNGELGDQQEQPGPALSSWEEPELCVQGARRGSPGQRC